MLYMLSPSLCGRRYAQIRIKPKHEEENLLQLYKVETMTTQLDANNLLREEISQEHVSERNLFFNAYNHCTQYQDMVLSRLDLCVVRRSEELLAMRRKR